ncbi:MAG TPA: hypothetical protein V6C71_09975 [Coleofasciculaceae cyanobacterium]|jgi:hypothetical protein
MKKTQLTDLNKPNIKAKVRNFMPVHLQRGRKTDIYLQDEILWLTSSEAKQYQHLIEIISE